ncbi:uncharacterized protein RAG0_12822 [Rhynchosporium agropyri]|uniref:Uncharacterized protein n=1 Tax=Rhynchosporium agropyri TaxID=914238 RepID=A0A1E1L9R0_9HELO|nr:uncharacterized protein RAG0_12822 [Rhynchosporium agropyri]
MPSFERYKDLVLSQISSQKYLTLQQHLQISCCPIFIISNLSGLLPEDQAIIEIELVLITAILGAICNAGPLAHRQEATQNWPAHTLSYIDSAPEGIESLNANVTNLVPRVTHPDFDYPLGPDDLSWSREGCTTTDVLSGGRRHIGTVTYDAQDNPINVLFIKYVGEPGDKIEGVAGSTSSFSSPSFLFDIRSYMKVTLFALLAGASGL